MPVDVALVVLLPTAAARPLVRLRRLATSALLVRGLGSRGRLVSPPDIRREAAFRVREVAAALGVRPSRPHVPPPLGRRTGVAPSLEDQPTDAVDIAATVAGLQLALVLVCDAGMTC